MTKETAISLIIPTYNRPSSLERTIKNVLLGTLLPIEIIVIDQSQEQMIIKENQKICETNEGTCQIKYFHLSPPSLTAARNKGIEVSTGEVIVFSDDDVDVYPYTFASVCRCFSNPKLALLASIDDNSKRQKNLVSYFFGFKSIFKRHFGHVTNGVFGAYPKETKKDIKTEWAMGYFFAFRKRVLEESGIKFDQNLIGYAYAEDLDFSYSFYLFLKKNGYLSILSPTVRVRHNVSKEYRIPTFIHTLFFVFNREYISYKMFPKSSRLATRWGNFGLFFVRLLKRERALDVFRAQRLCDNYRKQIRGGDYYNLISSLTSNYQKKSSNHD